MQRPKQKWKSVLFLKRFTLEPLIKFTVYFRCGRRASTIMQQKVPKLKFNLQELEGPTYKEGWQVAPPPHTQKRIGPLNQHLDITTVFWYVFTRSAHCRPRVIRRRLRLQQASVAEGLVAKQAKALGCRAALAACRATIHRAPTPCRFFILSSVRG